MLDKLRNNPWITSLLVFALYVGWFLAPALLHPERIGQAAPEGATQADLMRAQITNQIPLIIGLTAIVAILIWWRPVGFRRWEKGSLKFTLPPLLYSLAIISFAGVMSLKGGVPSWLGAGSLSSFLVIVLVTLMVGYTEELMFRGILFHGATARFRYIWGTIISSLLFGLLHFENLLGGQPLGATVDQVIHAGADGFMYASLRLITGSLWPVMILHGIWDLSVTQMQTVTQSQGGVLEAVAKTQVGGISPMQFLPGLLYGAFVLWRWTVRSKKKESKQ